MMTDKNTKYLERTQITVTEEYQCNSCGDTITGNYYYKEIAKDHFLQWMHPRRFCVKCYEKFGDDLMIMESKRKRKHVENKRDRKLGDFI